MSSSLLFWLGQTDPIEFDRSLLGGKAANLALLAAAGLPAPPAFCLTTAAYRAFLAHNGLSSHSAESDLIAAFAGAALPTELLDELTAAVARLSLPGGSLAVRSSATIEDLAAASFAGQGESVLGVQGDTEVVAAVRRIWSSLWSRRAQDYGPAQPARTTGRSPEMAVLVQQMIPCELAGIAFSVDPLDGAPAVVIEAVAGLGEALANGSVSGVRYRFERNRLGMSRMEEAEDLLSPVQIEQIADLALAAEVHFGEPQDIEWGIRQGQLFLFQSRPITVRSTGFFTEHLPGDDALWTGGFFNERFPRPVSPLGWTLLRELLEPLALIDPLRFLGVRPANLPPLLVKLYRGHPYASVQAFQMLYAVFGDRLLPADAYRFFPDGDVSLRHAVPYPRSIWAPRTFVSLAAAFLRQAGAASPWHNWRRWARFERRHQQVLARLERDLELGRPAVQHLWDLGRQAQELNRHLLELHRWSLTLADLTYTILQRLLAAWYGDAVWVAADLCAGLPSYSLELDEALGQMAAGKLGQERFLRRFGHRGFDLDIAHPTFADEPGQIHQLLERLGPPYAGAGPDIAGRRRQRQSVQTAVEARLVFWQRPIFRHVLRLAQTYMQLRENQRFVWQKTLAFQRRLFLRLATAWLDRPELIFGATLAELDAAVHGRNPLPRELIAARCAELHRLEEEHRQAPSLTYPPFLRGNQPLSASAEPEGRHLQGLPVSAGLGRGPARVVLSPAQFEQVRPGDVLVTRGADPGWTPLFGILAGLILETGGQLSHGAVVAREYGLPAVAALPGITTRLKDGQMVTLDGRTGRVTLD